MKIQIKDIKILHLNMMVTDGNDDITTYFMLSEKVVSSSDGRYECGLNMHLQRVKNDIIELDIELYGVFFLDNINQQELTRVLRINCAAILYPFLREKVASLMILGGYQPFFLPSKNFAKMYNDWLKTNHNDN